MTIQDVPVRMQHLKWNLRCSSLRYGRFNAVWLVAVSRHLS
jgi:hypothetical protein